MRGTGSITPAWPTHQVNDVALLFVETANEAPTLTVPAGFSLLTNAGFGTAGAAGSTGLWVYWCRATTTSQASPVVADSGDHQVAVILTFRGCITTGNPYDTSSADGTATAATAFTIPGITTTVDSDLIVLAISNGGDAATNQMTVAPVNANLSNIVERVDSQPTPTTQVVTKLRVGPYSGMNGLIGIGAGGDTGAPYYQIAGINPHSSLSTIDSDIATADALDILLFLVTEDSPANFGANTTAGFDFVKYTQKIDVMAGIPSVVDALQRQRAVALIGDEPYHSKWNNTWTPTLVNECARYHKQKFGQQCITVIRCDCNRLRFGWDGQPIPSSGWDQLDYGVIQYEGPNAQAGQTLAQAYAADKADGAAVNVGCIPAINMFAGGVHNTVDGIAACWDYLNNGTSSGVVAGTVQGSPSPFSVGQQIDCATWTATPTNQRKTLMCSPAWIRKMIDEVKADASIVCLPFYTNPSSNLAKQYVSYSLRSDWVAAVDYAVTQGLGRSSFNGWATPKAYIP